MKKMSIVFLFATIVLCSFHLLLETFLLNRPLLWAAEGIISKVPDPSGKFCHLKFPAIREETLFSGRPVLKDPSDGDIIDFYGPCDHDPLGREEIFRQRVDLQRQRRREYGSD
jgi:hypothetical protein